MGETPQRRLIRYGIAAAIVIVIAGLFVQREILGDEAETVVLPAATADTATTGTGTVTDPDAVVAPDATAAGTEVEIGLLDDRSAGEGDEAPDFLLTVLNGEPVRLSDFRGKTVVLNFWASWCPPCRAEMPEFQELWEQRGPGVDGVGGPDDLVILAVDFLKEDTVGAAADFVEDFELTFPVLFDTPDSDVAARYGVRGLPATYFIDPSGVIRARNLGPVFGNLLPEGVAAADAGGDSAAAR
ncbi:MAG: TlpA disulfide reductase family protein [Chloroflexi bacterium]|nr:TlpA disulfide reductase family protein [Chloroflexota bacterium]